MHAEARLDGAGGMPAIPNVAAAEVADFLARHRPPGHCHVEVSIPPHREAGPAAHEVVLAAVLTEQLTVWPKGTALVIEYRGGWYVQSLAYPPAFLTEIGELSDAQLALAVNLGWINPKAVPAGQPDFESRPVWADNPVREWRYGSDSIPEVARFLAESARTVLGRDPAAGYTLSIWNDLDEDDELDELAAAASLTITVPSVPPASVTVEPATATAAVG